jgi:hypothetical protein
MECYNCDVIQVFSAQVIFKGCGLQPGCFFFRIGSELAFAFGKPLCSQAYEKAIPSSGLATAD